MRILAHRLFWAFLVSLFFLATITTQAAGPALVQQTAAAASGSASSFSLSFPANTNAGDIILVAFDFDANAGTNSVADSQGNLFTGVGARQSSPDGSIRSRVYYAKSIKGGPDTVTVNLTANSAWIEVFLTEYSGIDLVNPIDTQVGATGGAGSVSSGSAATRYAGDVIYGYCATEDGGICSAGSGFNVRSTFNNKLIEDQLSGNPGNYAVTGAATNGWTMQMVALKPASSVVGGAPAITSTTTASGTMGSAFSYQIAATNTPSSYAAAGLPAGLSVNTGTGLISGTPTTSATYTVTLSATNGSGTGNATLTLTIHAAATPAPAITSATSASGTVESAFSYQITATNTPSSYAAVDLPAGLSVNTGTGLISGTPTTSATLTVALSATNGSGTGTASLTLTINPDPPASPAITSANSANGTAGSAFSYQIVASNKPASYAAAGLPAGLSVNTATGLISGTPTTAGTSTVSVSATNSSGTGNATLTLTIASAASGAFVQVASNAASGSPSTLSLAFSANTNAGDLILVAFDYSTAATPSSVTDSQGNVFTAVGNQLTSPGGVRSRVFYAKNIKGGADTVTVNLTASSSYLELYMAEYSGLDLANPIDAQASASGSAGAVSSGNATTNYAGDVIYGFCVGDWVCSAGSGFTARSTFNGNLIEDEMAGNPGSYAATGSATNGWTMQMLALKPATSVPAGVGAMPVITSPTTATGMMGGAFSYQITATNAPTSYAATGLPAGLSVNTGSGMISGTPTAVGTSPASLSAANASGTGEATLTLTVNLPALVFLTTVLPNGRVGSAYGTTLTASGGTTPYSWSLISGTLPAGLSLNASSGAITGTPTQAATNTLTFEVSDSSNPIRTQTASLTLTVSSAQGQMLALSSNRKYLVNTITGKPVFVVGDDAFDLATVLSSTQVSQYLQTRAAQGFNAIWVTTIDNSNQISPPKNFYGNVPFDGADFTNFDANYWENVDSVLSTASSNGIAVFLQPFFASNASEQPDQYYSSLLAASPATLQAYGAFLGNRYKGYDNIVWLLGGDAKPTDAGVYSQLNILGMAIAAADPNHLMTFEACEQCVSNGYNSVSGFQAAGLGVPTWLSLNWAYPEYATTVAAAQNAYSQTPFLPPLSGENFYELENSMTEPELRFEMYTEILSGAYLGRIFGNGAIWSFNAPNGSTCINGNDSCRSGDPTWQSQLTSAGSISQEYQGRLFSSREHWLLVPDINHAVVTAGYGSGQTETTAARTSDGQTIVAYIPNGNATTITVAMDQITSTSNTVRGWWFNPTTAATTNLGTFANSGSRSFTAPDGNDWVLVLDDASANLTAPGTGAATAP
jgi:hypothetical protein